MKYLIKFMLGGRYKIVTEEREGFVDTSLIIGNIVRGDDMTRLELTLYNVTHHDSYLRYKCSGSNSLGAEEKFVTIDVVGKETSGSSKRCITPHTSYINFIS